MSVVTLCDSELLRNVTSGCSDSFEELVSRYESRVFHLALHLTQSQEEAEEVLAQVFVKLYREAGSFDDSRTLSTWVYKEALDISIERCLELVKESDYRIECLEAKYGDSATHAGLQEQFRKALLSSISHLPKEYQHVFLLRDVNQLSPSEVSNVLALPLAEVKARLHRARFMIRRTLQECFERAREAGYAFAGGLTAQKPYLSA